MRSGMLLIKSPTSIIAWLTHFLAFWTNSFVSKNSIRFEKIPPFWLSLSVSSVSPSKVRMSPSKAPKKLFKAERPSWQALLIPSKSLRILSRTPSPSFIWAVFTPNSSRKSPRASVKKAMLFVAVSMAIEAKNAPTSPRKPTISPSTFTMGWRTVRILSTLFSIFLKTCVLSFNEVNGADTLLRKISNPSNRGLNVLSAFPIVSNAILPSFANIPNTEPRCPSVSLITSIRLLNPPFPSLINGSFIQFWNAIAASLIWMVKFRTRTVMIFISSPKSDASGAIDSNVWNNIPSASVVFMMLSRNIRPPVPWPSASRSFQLSRTSFRHVPIA